MRSRDRLPTDRSALARDCRWPLDGLPPDKAEVQLLCWLLLDRPDPATGRTSLRDFAEKDVLDPSLREMLLWMEHPRWGEHRILGARGNILDVEDCRTRERLTVEVPPALPSGTLTDRTMKGALHRWGSGWRPVGIVTFSLTPAEVFARTGLITDSDWAMEMVEQSMVKDAEKLILRPGATLTSILNKYPSQWVDGICLRLGVPKGGKKGGKAKAIAAALGSPRLGAVVSRLPPDSKAALRFVMERGGSVPLGTLERAHSAAVGMWWGSRAPTTPAGRLRALGLLVVGRVPDRAGRLARTAMIPVELRRGVSEALGIGPLSARIGDSEE